MPLGTRTEAMLLLQRNQQINLKVVQILDQSEVGIGQPEPREPERKLQLMGWTVKEDFNKTVISYYDFESMPACVELQGGEVLTLFPSSYQAFQWEHLSPLFER